MATFHERLHQSTIEYGGQYDPVMRRSFQTVLMFEANRCLKDKLSSLRPFQRKLAVFDQAKHLMDEIGGESSLVGMTTRERRDEVMWKTGTSKEPLNPETMWARASRLTKDVEKVAEQVRNYIKEKLASSDNKITLTSTHEETYRSFVENLYDTTHPNIPPGSEAYPLQFEYTHNHLFLAYKMYYRKGELDPLFPKPSAREIIVPREKPPGGLESYGVIVPVPVVTTTAAAITSASASASASATATKTTTTTKTPRRLSSKSIRATATATATTVIESPLVVSTGQKASASAAAARSSLSLQGTGGDRRSTPNQQQLPSFQDPKQQQQLSTQDHLAMQRKELRRRELLCEVKDHMDLLSQFEGIIDPETLKKRKRALFLSLPSPPPPNEKDKQQQQVVTTSDERQGSSSETESDDDKNAD